MLKTLIIYIASVFLINSNCYGQNDLETQFLKDKVLGGDTINLSYFSKTPIQVDTNEFFAYIILTKKRGIIDSTFEVRSVTDKLSYNNQFNWDQLDTTDFVITGNHSVKKDFRAKNSFSLPIQLDSNTVIIQYGWYYHPSYAGEQIDVWQLVDGVWEKVSSYLLWMS